MRDVRRLLLAIDLHRDGRTLTAGGCFAADQAAELAKRIGCAVVVLHAVASEDAASDETVVRHVLEQQAQRFRSLGVDAEVALIASEPAGRAIVAYALRNRIDLLVAGRRNERTQGTFHLGSVSQNLVHDCHCPVWVVKPGGSAAPRRVLAASDLSPVGERVLEYAAFVASHWGAELHVLHSFEPLPDEILVQNQRDACTRRLTAQLARIAAPRATQFHVGPGEASDAVLAWSSRIDADLVVMGTLSRGGVRRLLLGNTAERLLGRLDTSLLAVKPDDFVCPVA